MKTIKLLVLGTGGMAAQHVLHFGQDARVELVACADVMLERAQQFSAAHGIAKSFGSL